jgi:uncharacterized protein
MYQRTHAKTLQTRLEEPRRFIQVLSGPRQAGKTTLVRQALEKLSLPSHYASADEPTLQDHHWIQKQWDQARLLAGEKKHQGAVLVLDEIQKAGDWAVTVKRLWDEDSASGSPLKAVLLGSAPLLIQKGLTESLAGRFELIHVNHWTYGEMKAAFGWTLDQYVYYGGYPGSAPLIRDHDRWIHYIRDSLIETTLSRDVLLLTRVDKPALLRRLFQLGCEYSGQILSYQKMLGQLQDAGNTTTLAHYADLLSKVGMLMGIPKYAGQKVRQRASSPKWQVLNTALLTASHGQTFETVRNNPEAWGRWVESAVGAHLANGCLETNMEVFYWRERNQEVDFVLKNAKELTALEVKGGLGKTVLPGMEAFSEAFKPKRSLMVGGQGIKLGEFLEKPISFWSGKA